VRLKSLVAVDELYSGFDSIAAVVQFLEVVEGVFAPGVDLVVRSTYRTENV
jgi:hypothetical protein